MFVDVPDTLGLLAGLQEEIKNQIILLVLWYILMPVFGKFVLNYVEERVMRIGHIVDENYFLFLSIEDNCYL